MANFYREVWGEAAHPRWVGDWEGVAGRNGQTYMIWRNPNQEVQRISPYAVPKGDLRNEMIRLCMQERAERHRP